MNLSTPIEKTDWIVVRTDDDQMFFYHSKNKKSFWQLPEELQDVQIPEPLPEHKIGLITVTWQ